MKIYEDARTFWEAVQDGQIQKGIRKYGRPLNEAEWSAEELIQHAMEETVDTVHYLTALREIVRKLEQDLEDANGMIDALKSDFEGTQQDLEDSSHRNIILKEAIHLAIKEAPWGNAENGIHRVTKILKAALIRAYDE